MEGARGRVKDDGARGRVKDVVRDSGVRLLLRMRELVGVAVWWRGR